MMKIKAFLFVLILGLVLVGCGEVEPSDTSADEPVDEETTEEETSADTKKETEEPKEYKIGDTVSHDDYELIVNGIEKSNGGEFETPKDGNEFVIVEVTINNNGEEQISYNPFDFKLKNSQGQITDSGIITVDSDTALHSGELAADGTVSGTISFEAPKDDPDLRLIFEPNFITGEQVEVLLSEGE